jgi:hypothetical protein
MTKNRAFWNILLPLLTVPWLPLSMTTASKAENTPWDIVPCNLVPTLFRHDNFRDRFPLPLQVSLKNLHNRALRRGDSISSLCVPQGWAIVVYKDDSFRGRNLEVVGPAFWTDLKRNRPNGMNWGDTISSVAVFKRVDGGWQRMPTH